VAPRIEIAGDDGAIEKRQGRPQIAHSSGRGKVTGQDQDVESGAVRMGEGSKGVDVDGALA
jgi:hypothetical protein